MAEKEKKAEELPGILGFIKAIGNSHGKHLQ